MDFTEEMDEEQLIEYAIQMSIEESYSKPSVPTQCARIERSSKENQKIFNAIDQGDVLTIQEHCHISDAFSEVDSEGWLPLHRAAVQPVLQVLEMVLDASSHLNLEEKTEDGDTALILAAQAGLLENVVMLLERGASPHNTNSNNETPLLFAVRNSSYEMVSTLVKNKALVGQICLKKWTVLHEAAKVGCCDILMFLLRNSVDISQTDGHGVSPLGIAAEHGHAEAMEILIVRGGDVNTRAYNGESVLYNAAGTGNPDCIDLLLLHGADPDIASNCGLLPIHRAAYLGHYLVLDLLISVTSRMAIIESGHSPLHSAAEGGHAQNLRLLIDKGFNVNTLLPKRIAESYDDMRRSVLYFAVSNGDVTSTEMLLKAGALPNADPLRCLLVAVRAGKYEIVRMLLSHGADVNCYFTVVSDTVFPTALQYCLRDEVMLRMLLNNGYDATKCFCCNHENSYNINKCWSNMLPYQTASQRGKIPFCDLVSLRSLRDTVGKLVRILLDYISHVPLCCKLKINLEHKEEWAEICDILGNPRSLKHLCRLIIRRHVTLRRLCDPAVMHMVPFPPRVKDYLLYKEHDLYGVVSS